MEGITYDSGCSRPNYGLRRNNFSRRRAIVLDLVVNVHRRGVVSK